MASQIWVPGGSGEELNKIKKTLDDPRKNSGIVEGWESALKYMNTKKSLKVMAVASLLSLQIFIAGCGRLWGGVSFFRSSDIDQTFKWLRQVGQAGVPTYGNSVAVDSSNNVYLLGLTSGNMVSCGGVSANCAGTSQGAQDYFVSKYNSDGTWIWTKQLGETGFSANPSGIAVDASANVYVTGSTDGNYASCGGVSAACAGNAQGGASGDYYISKYTSAGAWVWTVQLGETAKSTNVLYGLTTDSSSNIYIAGTTTGNLPSCSGVSASCSGSSKGTFDYFISKYTSGGAWVWTVQLGETAKNSTAYGLATDALSNIYIAGTTTGNLVSCSGISANCSGSAQGGANLDFFISKYTPTGVWVWTQQLGQTGKQVNNGNSMVAVDSAYQVYVTGSTSGNLASCNGISANCSGNATAFPNYDFFLVKY